MKRRGRGKKRRIPEMNKNNRGNKLKEWGQWNEPQLSQSKNIVNAQNLLSTYNRIVKWHSSTVCWFLRCYFVLYVTSSDRLLDSAHPLPDNCMVSMWVDLIIHVVSKSFHFHILLKWPNTSNNF